MRLVSRFRLRADEKELTPISFFFLLLSDVFIVYILFFGLSRQIQQLTHEYDYFPYTYREMLIDKQWVENNIVDNISEEILSRKKAVYVDSADIRKMHPACREIETLLIEIAQDAEVVQRFEDYDRLRKNYRSLSDQKNESSEKTELANKIDGIAHELNAHHTIQNVIRVIFNNQKNDYVPDLIKQRRLFALKRVVLDFVFLLPIIALFIVWNRVSFKRHSSIGLVVSSHYILISFIPILFEVVRLIVEIIPTILLKTIYDFLLSLNLISVWYYAVIVVFILVVLCVLWFLQTKVFTREKYNIKRFANKKCMRCNTRIDYTKNYCPICGERLHIECPACKKQTVRGLNCCINCGEEL